MEVDGGAADFREEEEEGNEEMRKGVASGWG